MISQIDYTNGKSCVFKSGNLDFAAYRQHETITKELDWAKEVNYKNDNFSKDETKQMFNQEVICCFHPNRYEKPSWMHESYYQDARAALHFGIYQNLANRIPNKIIADNCFEDTLSWLLDIIADSRVDVEQDAGGNLTIAHKPPPLTYPCSTKRGKISRKSPQLSSMRKSTLILIIATQAHLDSP